MMSVAETAERRIYFMQYCITYPSGLRSHPKFAHKTSWVFLLDSLSIVWSSGFQIPLPSALTDLLRYTYCPVDKHLMDLWSIQASTLRSYLIGTIKYRFLCFFRNWNTNSSRKPRNFTQFYSMLRGFSIENDLTLQKFMKSVWSWVIQSFSKRCWQLRLYQKIFNSRISSPSTFREIILITLVIPIMVQTTPCGIPRSAKFCILRELTGDMHETCETAFSPWFYNPIQWHAFCLIFSVIDETLTIQRIILSGILHSLFNVLKCCVKHATLDDMFELLNVDRS